MPVTRIAISHNAPQLEKQLEQFLQRLPSSQKKALSVAGESLFVTSRRLLTQLVYQKEIPKGKNGKPLWRRKMRAGGMLGAETYAITMNGFQYVIFTDPGMAPGKAIRNWPGGYAQKKHWRDGKYTQAAPWRQRAATEGMPRAVNKFRESIKQDMASAGLPWRG